MLPPFLERLARPVPLLLDGATGTELHRRGVETTLPLWSAAALVEAPDVVRDIHRDNVAAGAELITANTFRTHPRNLAAAGWETRAAELTGRAVRLAREAAGARAYVAGSQAPLEDCYHPELVADDGALAREHRVMADNLAAAGVDVILVETQNTVREALAAARAATATGLPTLVSFVCGADGRLLSGETLDEAVGQVLPLSPAALLINCSPAPTLLQPLRRLRRLAGTTPVGAYANIGRADDVQGWINTDAEDPARYARYAQTWLDAGARLVGGCCGTTPAHIEEIHQRLAPSS